MQLLQLGSKDAESFLAYRAAALTMDPDSFRFAGTDDEAHGLGVWKARLGSDYVIAACKGDRWIGVGGLAQLVGTKLSHKGLIWGMHVIPEERGSGAARLIMKDLVDNARGRVRQVQLTVMADNARAIAFYERFGFEQYAVEPDSVRRDHEFADEALMWRRV